MAKEAYCSYEVSKLLKEKGFEIDTNNDYWKIGNDGTMYFMSNIGAYTSDVNCPYAFYRPEDSYPSPTHQMALAWIREKYNLHISTCIFRESFDTDGDVSEERSYWSFSVRNTFDGQFEYQDYYHANCTEYQSHEEAVEAALKYVLTNYVQP